ncbi:leader peptidase (prepilin peptidase)/N-methyltransferase [Saccharomonospora amisosensis]|uniref:Leader peptidase (Prepilin peptidase)/N-methyltransferase n=1 Tax=Saccharomonospora amisosensis TaxID=1128677 RepID=A0A7X5UQ46_9PSEU|nr:A24 family peptidase [Saccharomonospora amisosensis]NIJ11669.1 leader peptidase (prepilin peptidase)/N-methyltransferase [Saccharomonospora amisosensis]
MPADSFAPQAESVFWGLIFAVTGFAIGWAASRVLCHAPRPAAVPVRWCAAGTASLWAAVAWRWTAGGLPAWWLPVPLVVTALSVPLAVADLGHRRLPDALTVPAYPLAALALGIAAVAGPGGALFARAVLAAVLFAGVHALVHAVAPTALGAGDVKLSGSLGAVVGATGWQALVVTASTAAVTTLGLAATAAALRVRRWRDGVPHGPGLLMAACLVTLFPGAGSEVHMGS